MSLFSDHRIALITTIVLAGIVLLLVAEFLYIKYAGTPVPVPNIPREPQVLGEGKPLRYAVLGDSTAVGQGGDYEQGIARSTARHLAAKYTVTLQNFAISGARAKDVLGHQVDAAVQFKPDIALIAVGANDVTHLTPLHDFETSLDQVIAKLKKANPSMQIILTGSPQMGSVPRFPQPVSYLARLRTDQINDRIDKVAKRRNVTFARIAERTGPAFSNNPDLFAADKFHPNNDGYGTWVPVLTKAIDRSLINE